jgi:hypothetical protein
MRKALLHKNPLGQSECLRDVLTVLSRRTSHCREKNGSVIRRKRLVNRAQSASACIFVAGIGDWLLPDYYATKDFSKMPGNHMRHLVER